MNKLTLLILLLVASLLFSCKRKTIVDLTIEPSDTSATILDTINIKYTLTPDIANKGKIGDFSITVQSSNEILFETNYSSSETITDSIKYIVPQTSSVGEQIVLVFKAIDEKSAEETIRTAIITVQNPGGVIVQYSDIQAFFNATNIESNFIFELTYEGAYSRNGNFANGQLAFIWTDAGGYSIVSPDAACIQTEFLDNGINYSTDDKQNTKIQSYSGTWEDLDATSINDLNITSQTVTSGGNGVENLQEGDIVIFETEEGKKGTLKVRTLVKDTKYFAADFKYQPPAPIETK